MFCIFFLIRGFVAIEYAESYHNRASVDDVILGTVPKEKQVTENYPDSRTLPFYAEYLLE